MIRERHFSTKFDFHTGIVAKISFGISLLLLSIVAIEILLGITVFLPASIFFAFAILFLGITGISWFFHFQFSKLSQIASDIENEELNQK